MSKNQSFPESISTPDLANVLGISPARLGQLVAAGIITKTSRGVYPATAIAEYCQFLRGGGAEDQDPDENDGTIDLRRERAALVAIQRKIAERELGRLEAKFVDVDAVATHLAAEFNIVKHRIRGLPTAVAPKLSLLTKPAEIADYLRKEIDIILTDLADTGDEIIAKTIRESNDQ
jgi:phage terminase Nu1 subunit (DNA packaging protein)